MSPAVWYFARSAGLVAYLLLSASVILGVLMSARASFTWPRFAVEEVHRFLAILTGIFVTLHGASLLLDRVVPIGLGQMLVPFTSPYRPFAVGLGVHRRRADGRRGADEPLPQAAAANPSGARCTT